MSGLTATTILAVGDDSGASLCFYLIVQADGRWFRIMVDEGVLVVEPTHPPNVEDHHDDESDILYVVTKEPHAILDLSIHLGQMRLRLSGGGVLEACEDPDTSMMRVLCVGLS